MSLEQQPPSRPPQPTPAEAFGFTEQEILFDRVSDARFNALLGDEATTIHRVEMTSNSYGEFLFCTVSRPDNNRRIFVSFYGLGHHEFRERWLTDEWFWYVTHPWPDLIESEVARTDALERIQARQQEIAAFAARETQSQRGQLFEILADLGDDDGAIAMMDELPWELFDDEP